jgi:hypothetical protein
VRFSPDLCLDRVVLGANHGEQAGGMAVSAAMTRVHRHGGVAKDVAFNQFGQVVGTMNEMKNSREMIYELNECYLEAVEQLNAIQPEA